MMFAGEPAKLFTQLSSEAFQAALGWRLAVTNLTKLKREVAITV